MQTPQLGIYLLESSLFLLLLGLLYLPLMKQRSWPGFHRIYLLAAPAIALMLPVLRTWSPWLADGAIAEWTMPVQTIAAGSATAIGNHNPYQWLWLAYALPALALLTYRVIQWTRLLVKIKSWPQNQDGMILTNGKLPTSACFGYILWDEEEQLSEQDRAYILTHERAHVRLGHTWDLLWYHLLGSLLWFHPLLPFARRELLLVHELQADREAVGGVPNKGYLQLLVRRTLQTRPSLVQPFGPSFLKARARAIASRSPIVRSGYLVLVLAGLMILALGPHFSMMAMPGIEENVEVDRGPGPLNMAEVQRAIGYPQEARDQGIEGMVVARILVDESGNYVRHEWAKAEPALLVEAVEQEIAQLEFTPAQKDGKPVWFWVNLPFNFKLLK